jgi:ATP-dependent helicase/nuclease subunit B
MRAASSLLPPPLTALLGPAGSGKTAACLERLRGAQGRALLLVPSGGHADRLKERLKSEGIAEEAGLICPFGDLVKFLAGGDGGKDGIIRRTFQRIALADIFAREIGPEDYFGRMRGVPGFIGALAEAIRELKLSGIMPEELEAGAKAAAGRVDDPNFERKAGEIARLYRAYEAFLRAHDLRDEDDLPRIAAERVADGADIPRGARLALVDGFYRFSRVWRDLLASLSNRGVKVVVTLEWEESRPLLFATPSRTLESLRYEFTLEEIILPAAGPGALPDDLYLLERGLFAGKPEIGTRTSHPPIPPSPHPPLMVFDAPNPYTEVEMAARALRREHDERGIPWERCAILLRSVADYAPTLSGVCEKYGIPLALQQGLVVSENPLIKTILKLFDVFLRGWQREDVIAFLKSSYTSADKLRADALRLRAKRRGLREGREGWERIAADLQEKGDIEQDLRPRANPVANVLRQMLEWSHTLLSRRRTADDFVAEFGFLLTEFGWEEPHAPADKHALQQAREALTQIAHVARLTGRGPMPFEEMHREMAASWETVNYHPPPDKKAVVVMEPYDARQLDAQFVAVMGLTERVFPRRINEDPFFRDEERAALLEAAELALAGQRERQDDERLLFYLAVTAPSERLILSFPRSDDESDTLRSFYLDEVYDVLGNVPTEARMLSDVAPLPEECVNDRDRLLAAIQNVDVASLLATRNRPRLPRLESEELRRAFAASRRYSITEIETYNNCPFQYLMKHGMNLRPESDGAGAADKGTLLHAVLRRYFRRRAESPEGPTVEQMRTALREELDACLTETPVDARPYRRHMMERALTDALDGFAEREARYSEVFGLTPAHFELAFGMEEESPPEDEEVSTDAPRDCDPSSTARPLVIPNEDGPPVQVCGVIDRVDLMPDGRRALVMDYKLGSPVPFPRIKEGRSVQLPLYMLALEQLWGRIGAVGCYDSPNDRGRRRFFRTEHADIKQFGLIAGVETGGEVKPVSRDEFDETMEAAQQAVRRAAAGIAAGEVVPTPGDHCRFCDYGDVCRTLPGNVHDGEPYPPE